MGRWISKFILRLMGWQTNGSLPEGIKKAVVVSAPHTSYWDFIIGRLTFWAIRVNIRFLIKQEVFIFPLGFLLKKMGGVPVERVMNRAAPPSQVSQNQEFTARGRCRHQRGARAPLLRRQWCGV